MSTLKKKIAEFLLLTVFFVGLITFAYSQEPKRCPSNGTWIDPHGFTAICNVPDCYEAVGSINKWVSLSLIVLIAYFAGLRSKGQLTIESVLFRVGVYLTFISVIIASELSKVPEGSCLTFKPLTYIIAVIGSFFVAWFHR
ncbi:hypothetical protein [Thermococcus sp.]|uniref:hypothetical protein n=1 Tax=Thermococcus sp. TaxID=35749 RepID=UPI0025F756A1|nr:hypothetical protein [Thermococcus sp.]